MQKKVIAIVKFSASCDGLHPNSRDRGALRIDHAYRTPAKSIDITPIER